MNIWLSGIAKFAREGIPVKEGLRLVSVIVNLLQLWVRAGIPLEEGLRLEVEGVFVVLRFRPERIFQ